MKHIGVCILLVMLVLLPLTGAPGSGWPDCYSCTGPATIIESDDHVVPDQLQLVGDELSEQLWFHHRSAGR